MAVTDRDEAFDVELDELDQFVAEEAATDPAFAAAHVDAGARSRLLREMVACRKHAKRSQAAVASLMGTTQSAVSELEGGASDPRLSTLQRYARAVGCSLYFELVNDAGRRLYTTPRPGLSDILVGFDVTVLQHGGSALTELSSFGSSALPLIEWIATTVPSADHGLALDSSTVDTADNYALAS